MYHLELDKMPPSINHAYFFKRMGKRTIKIKTKEAKDYFKFVRYEAFKQVKKISIIRDPVKLDIVFYFGDKRRRDIENYTKLLIDSMNGIFWMDDCQISDLHVKKRFGEKGKFKIVVDVHLAQFTDPPQQE